MAPVTGIPYEILSRIFQLACLDEFRRPELGKEFRHFPIMISHVNQQFRNVAITTANLWARIYIEYDNSTDVECLCRRLQLSLERSGHLPLDIEIISNIPSERKGLAADVYIDDIMALLLPCSLRWQSFCPSVRDEESFWAVLLLCNRPAPALRRFESNVGRRLLGTHSAPEQTPILPNDFELFQGQASLLDSVRLGPLIELNWFLPLFSNLKHLELRSPASYYEPTLSEWMVVLRSSPHLEFLAIEGMYDWLLIWPDSTVEGTSITMDSLTNVELFVMGLWPVQNFLKTIDLPRLQSFSFTDISVPNEWSQEDELPLCSQRYPTLTRLEMCPDEVPTAWTRRLFEVLPTIEELYTVEHFSSALLPLIESDAEAQKKGLPGPVLLPKLRWLGLGRYDGQEVVDFVSGRRAIDGGTLTHLAISAVDKPNFSESQLDFLRSVLHVRFSDAWCPRARIWYDAPPIPSIE